MPIWIYGLLFCCFSLILTGYHVYGGNQALQLPLVELLNDSSLYHDDPFASTLPYYASMLWHLVALCTRAVPLEPLLLVLFLIERSLVIYASGYLAYVLAQKSRLAVIGAMALFALAPAPILGGGTLVRSYFEQTGLSIPFFLLAIASFYKDRPISWAILLSIGFNLNSMYGAYAITYFATVFLLDSRYRAGWKRYAIAVVLFALLTTPAIIHTASAFGRSAPDNNLWLMAARVRVPHHLYPLTWNKTVFIKFCILLLLNIALLHQSRRELRLFKQGIVWAGVSLCWLVYAFGAAYIIKSPSMLAMHPARGTDLWYCFAGIALISICAIRVEKSAKNRIILTAVFFASVFFWRPIPASFILLGLIALAWRPMWDYAFCKGSPNRLALLLVLLLLFQGGRALQRRLTTGVGGVFMAPPITSVREIADWAKEETPVEATFLVNPNWADFRALSKRPVLVTWKDGSAILWDRTFVREWAERLHALGLDITQPTLIRENIEVELDRLYRNLHDNNVNTLKTRFKIRYWIVTAKHPSAFPIVFQNQCFKVLVLK